MPLIISSLRLASSTTAQPEVILNPSTVQAHTFRASTVTDMYDIISDLPSSGESFKFVYNIGQSTGGSHTVKIRNKSISNSLGLGVIFSNYLQVVPFGIQVQRDDVQMTQTYVIPSGYVLELTVSLDNTVMLEKIKTGQRVYNGSIQFLITPLNVTGPVVVQDNLNPLTL